MPIKHFLAVVFAVAPNTLLALPVAAQSFIANYSALAIIVLLVWWKTYGRK